MTLIIPPGFGNAAFTFTAVSGTPPFVTTLGLDISAWAGDFVGAANAAMSRFGTYLASQIDGALTLDRVSLAIGQDGPSGSVDSDLTPISMNKSGTGAPAAMAPVVRKVTNELGRRGRGRMFLPMALSQNEVGEDGVITPTRVSALNTALDSFYNSLVTPSGGGTPLPPVLLHSAAPTDPSEITGLVCQPLVGWIRGRIR